jgi:hypothetical protein
MCGPKPLYPIELTNDEAIDLRRLIRAHTSAQTHVLRAKIVLTAAEQPSWTAQQIADWVGTSDRMVRKWRRCWSQTGSLSNAPRSGAPRRFSPCDASASQRHSLFSAVRAGRAARALSSR